jgi:transposase-like protein
MFRGLIAVAILLVLRIHREREEQTMETLDRDVLRIATRRVWSRADGTRVVEAWRRSGMSRAAFARQSGLPVHRLHYWIANTAAHPGRGAPPRPPHAVVRFHPVRVVRDGGRDGVREVVPEVGRPREDANAERSATAAPIEIRSIRIPRGWAPAEVRAVLRALESLG